MSNQELDKPMIKLYYNSLINRTYALLPLYEQHPKETFQRHTHDLICEVIGFNKFNLQADYRFGQYLGTLGSLLEPSPIGTETEHKFVRRHILDAVGLIKRIGEDVLEG